MNYPHAIELDHRDARLSTEGVSTSMHAHTTTDKQTIRLIVADGRSTPDDETIIWPASFRSRADILELNRSSILAARTQSRVVYVETPGISIDLDDPASTSAGTPSPLQLLQVANGNFDPLARKQLDALDSVLEFEDGQELRFIGYSMGAWATSSMAKLLAHHHFPDRQIIIPRIDMIEAVNDQKYALSELVRNIGQEAQFTARYLQDENEENGLSSFLESLHAVMDDQRIAKLLNRRQSLLLKALPIGIRRGFADSLIQAVEASPQTTRLTEGSIHFWRANESLVARQEANEHTISQLGQVATQLTEIYPTVRDHVKGHHHSLVHSLGTIANFAEHHLRSRTSRLS